MTKYDPPTPSITYTSVQNLFTAIRRADSDALRVEGITATTFAEIVKRRSEGDNIRFFFLEPEEALIVTIPGHRHEAAVSRISYLVNRDADQMGLLESLIDTRSKTFIAAAGRRSSGPGEPDGSFTPILPNTGSEPWPSVVIEVGDSQSLGDLRHKAARWLILSHYTVRVAFPVKTRVQQSTIAIEKWTAVNTSGRSGATTTRVLATTGREPRKVQEILILRPSIDGQNADPLDAESYVVVRGPLRLGFAELFLREPSENEHDIVFEEGRLIRMAIQVLRHDIS